MTAQQPTREPSKEEIEAAKKALDPIPTQEEIDAVFLWEAAPWLGKSPTAPDSVRLHCAKVLAGYGERLYGHEMEYFDQLNCIVPAILKRAYLRAAQALASAERDAERLDWLEQAGKGHLSPLWAQDWLKIRSAIDAAQAAQRKDGAV